MFTRYLSYDIREGNDYTKLYEFIEEYGGQGITDSLYVFKTDVELSAFKTALRKAVRGDDSVYLILWTDKKMYHERVV